MDIMLLKHETVRLRPGFVVLLADAGHQGAGQQLLSALRGNTELTQWGLPQQQR